MLLVVFLARLSSFLSHRYDGFDFQRHRPGVLRRNKQGDRCSGSRPPSCKQCRNGEKKKSYPVSAYCRCCADLPMLTVGNVLDLATTYCFQTLGRHTLTICVVSKPETSEG